jgi:hypothetical protein
MRNRNLLFNVAIAAAMVSLFTVMFWAQVGGVASALAPRKGGLTPSRPAHTSRGFSRSIKRTGRAVAEGALAEASDRAFVGADGDNPITATLPPLVR